MAFIPAPNVVQVEMIYRAESQYLENVFHYRIPTPPDTTKMNSIAGTLAVEWSTHMKQGTANGCSLVEIKCTDLTTDDGITTSFTSTLPIAGTGGTESTPLNCAAILSWKSAARGRSARGRTYVPAVPETFTDQSVVNSTYLGYLDLWGSALMTLAPGDTTCELVILSRYHLGLPRVTAVCYAVTGFTTKPTIVSQRRRLPGRGT